MLFKSLRSPLVAGSTLSNTIQMSIRSISVGAKIPSTIVYENSPGNQVNLAEEVAEGKSIIIGVPGAFSPACSSSHKFFVVVVNDAFVTKAWGDALLGSTVAGAQIKFLADPSGAFTKDLDLLFDATKFFGNERSRRYALIVEDGTVTKTFVEPDNTSVVVSDSANVSNSEEFSKDDIDKAKAWLQSFTVEQIPTHIFDISYSRSSGAGGQKVNKTSSKATVALEPSQWLDPQYCYWIPLPVRRQISAKKIRYETKKGGILIQSDTTRNRDVNTDECFRKLLQEIKDTTFFAGEVSEEDKKRWEEIREDAKEKRMFNKKKQSDKKKSRQKKFDW
ncbi:hypothetical protein G9P44_001369 [Scheffersomyces stipitis]|nr:hypothetical protein G9P44_001369 [Scheffersomyces stipitis]